MRNTVHCVGARAQGVENGRWTELHVSARKYPKLSTGDLERARALHPDRATFTHKKARPITPGLGADYGCGDQAIKRAHFSR